MRRICRNNRTLYGQRAGGPAAIRNRSAQSLPIQHSTPIRGILKTAASFMVICFFAFALPSEVCAAVATGPVRTFTKRGAHKEAAGNRNRTSGALNNVGSNGNWWTFSPNNQTNARNLNFNSTAVNPLNTNNRANGYSVLPSRALGRRPVFYTNMVFNYKDIHVRTTAAYLKAREEERDTPAQLAFELCLEDNLRALADEIHRRTWRPQPLDWFVNLKPTVREVFAPKFRDRVVSHVLFDMIAPIFERYFIADSSSCRIGRGTLYGIRRLEHHIRSVTDNYRVPAWCLGYDITGYFMSIDRARLREITTSTLDKHAARFPDATDYGLATFLIDTYLNRNPLDGCVFHGDPARIKLVLPEKSLRYQPPGIGVPIGDVINQLFSNIYLNPLDQFILRDLRLPHSVRHVDDGKVLDRSRDLLEESRDQIGVFLSDELGLRLHPKKTRIVSLDETICYLGAAIRPYRRYAKNDAVTSFSKYIQATEEKLASDGLCTPARILPELNSRLGYLAHFRTWKVVDRALAGAPRIRENFIFSTDYSKATIKRKAV